MTEHIDVLIVGAGLSGIGAGVHLTQNCPDRSFQIFEARDAIGGTWDLFRYPGIRSDSDMHTLGYTFKPWTEAKAIADGPSIRRYVRETADEYGITRKIRFGRRVEGASWDSETAKWTVTARDLETDKTVEVTCSLLFMCSGYYDYDEGHRPTFEGEDAFKGVVVDPQHWPEDLVHANKHVVVIGSGATAVTIVPVMAKTAASMTMLQRSPTWMIGRPAQDWFANALRTVLPDQTAYSLIRARNTLLQKYMYDQTRTKPKKVREQLLKRLRKEVGPSTDIETHFTPSYDPWDQRLCLVPDNDFFHAVRDGKADVVTDHIDHFEENGIVLKSGQKLRADIVVKATGLKMKMLGGMTLSVDGKNVNPADHIFYKGMMLSDVPNLINVFGYLNASWTLKADLISDYACRLLNHMEETGVEIATPTLTDPDAERLPFNEAFSSGYIARAADVIPKQGKAAPWKLYQDFYADRKLMGAELDDGVMVFSAAKATEDSAAVAAE